MGMGAMQGSTAQLVAFLQPCQDWWHGSADRNAPGSPALLPETPAGVLLPELCRGVVVQRLSPVLACPWEQQESQELRDPWRGPVPPGIPLPACTAPAVPPCWGAVCECMTRVVSAEISKRSAWPRSLPPCDCSFR